MFLQWVGLVTFTIQEHSHFLHPLFFLCIPILKSQVQLVVKSRYWFITKRCTCTCPLKYGSCF
ncbi:hypothetical protein C1N76_15845 [Geobacillus thermoleovorans]|uniref:Uncharacterized protein n=1 Tax=Geobacillus thermoleovorans TaxID=33941 RepID=A0A2Z3NAE9_GEOTH|nr:hypothetical protein C1N76_15845 [Geobacillus thermoleovorans]